MTPLKAYVIVLAVLAAGLVMLLSWWSAHSQRQSSRPAPPTASAQQGSAPAR